MVGPGVAIAVIMRRGVELRTRSTVGRSGAAGGGAQAQRRDHSGGEALGSHATSADVRAYDLRGYFSHLLHTARINPRFYKLFPRRYHRAGGIKYLRVLASGAPARRSQAVSGALCESQRRSQQRDGARGFVSGPRAPNQRPCSHQARLHRSLPRRRESSLSSQSGTPLSRSERSKVGDSNSCCDETGERIMASYGPELIQIMRAVLDEVMTKIPVDQVTPGVKAHMAEVILKAAAQGQTSYDALLASASDQIQTVLSLLT